MPLIPPPSMERMVIFFVMRNIVNEYLYVTAVPNAILISCPEIPHTFQLLNFPYLTTQLRLNYGGMLDSLVKMPVVI